MPKPPPWPPEGGPYRIERLAFFAAEPWMRMWAFPWYVQLLNPVLGRRARAQGSVHGISTFARLELACDRMALQMDKHQQATLRATGQLPPGFLQRLRAEGSRR